MDCVILPSEIARLVYGYLVKENLNDIAFQFLERSPYLMDCCQIVKSGYHFNTKLMGKDLPDLLQEYSVIHNLVNKKISLLCKTSLLYKRIKLRCESLPEILELILFWKYKNSKNEENSYNGEKNEKNSSGVEVNTHCESSNLADTSQTKVNENTGDSLYFNKNNSSNLTQKDSSAPETISSKLNYDSFSSNREQQADEKSGSELQVNDLENESQNSKNFLNVPVQNEENAENLDKLKANNKTSVNSEEGSVNITSSNGSVSGSENCLPDPKFNNNTNILTIDVTPECENLVNDEEIPADTLVSDDEPNRFENPIKIVGIQEQNQDENHSVSVFSKPLGEGEGNLSLGSSSVVFVSPDMGNVTINQDQSQIIVIPFDYYKPQNGLQSDMGIESNKDLGLIANEVVNEQKNNIIFEEETAGVVPSCSTSLYSEENEKSSAVDENIMTESDFLKNRQLMYNLEKELYKPEPALKPKDTKGPKETTNIQTVSAPVILVSQPLPTKTSRYRSILPKKENPMHPVVVVHPLLENNKDITKTKSTAPGLFPETKGRKEVSRRVRKKGIPQKPNNKDEEKAENKNAEPQTDILTDETVVNENRTENQENKLSEKEINVGNTQEEKENLGKTENKKNETPVFITKRNSKRLSLSTPRRRSHIRALEFETPPKTNEEKKKSKTSPKAKVEQVKVERKSVRNTLFKSPIPEDTFKSPAIIKDNKKCQSSLAEPLTSPEPVEPLNELSIPIATRSPNTKLSEAWENLTGVGCVIGQNNISKVSPVKKMWDADLRGFIPDNNQETEPLEKKRIRKPEKNQKDNRKSTKKKIPPPKRIKPIPVTVSPSKISLTAKRNTYSINGNEEGSPIRTLLDDLKIVTPFKDIDTIRPAEETPLTKLLRENINTIDIDLSMINTPSFPPTPSIVITPDLDDASLPGANYYSPTKDTKESSKDKVLKITDYFKVDPEKSSKKGNKEMHDKVIDDLVSKAKEIIGLGKEPQEENALKRRPSGKILSMVKIQMLTQCDKKLMENIPINEETTFSSSFTNQTIIGNVIEETAEKTDLKVELEEKRKRALKKIKVVKENLSQARCRVTKRGRKRKRSVNTTKSDKSMSDISKESLDNKQQSLELDESVRKETGILHSTPYAKQEKTDNDKKVNDKILDDIRQLFPPFQNDTQKYPELNEKSRKKLHYVENFLKLTEVEKFLNSFTEENPPKLFLKLSLRRFFHVFYKWLKHPHKRELNASMATNVILKEYLSLFDKVNLGLNHRTKKLKRDSSTPNVNGLLCSDASESLAGRKASPSDEDERDCKKRGSEKRKEEDAEDGVVSTLPLKKRKSTVQQVENKGILAIAKTDSKNSTSESVSQTQNFLQDIDVDRFLSQIHGQEAR